MKSPVLFYYSLFFALLITTSIVIINLVTVTIPAIKKHRNLLKFRKNLHTGMLVKIDDSDTIFKIVRINDNYSQLYHYSLGISGHPNSALFPVDYEF